MAHRANPTPLDDEILKERLFWNDTGRVNCGLHIPYVGSDTWRNERWKRITPRVAAQIAEAAARGLVNAQGFGCETCRAAAAK